MSHLLSSPLIWIFDSVKVTAKLIRAKKCGNSRLMGPNLQNSPSFVDCARTVVFDLSPGLHYLYFQQSCVACTLSYTPSLFLAYVSLCPTVETVRMFNNMLSKVKYKCALKAGGLYTFKNLENIRHLNSFEL